MVKKNKGNTYPNYPYSNGNSPAVTIYQPLSEAAPLLPGRDRYRIPATSLCKSVCLAMVLVLLLSPAYYTGVHFMRCPPDPATRDALRRDWELERMQHEATKREFEEMLRRDRMERELERQRWQRELEGRERREEEERQQHRMYWGNIEPHKCTTYATREYTAQLMNLPISWEHRVEACKATPLEIHGVSHLPSTCDDRGPGVVIGRWKINQQEPDCRTFWDLRNDKGCTSPGSGKKYITYKLENLPDGGNWGDFCATTPIQFDNMKFPGAHTCFPSVWGIFGQWEIDDSSC